jgi:hypothetical protein
MASYVEILMGFLRSLVDVGRDKHDECKEMMLLVCNVWNGILLCNSKSRSVIFD